MMNWKRIKLITHLIIEREDTLYFARWGKLYSAFMLVATIVSIIPLAFHQPPLIFRTLEYICVGLFIIDYFLRWFIADVQKKKFWKSILLYPFTFMAIVDLLSILPVFFVINQAFMVMRTIRVIMLFRIFKIFRHSKEIALFIQVVREQKAVLFSVFFIAVLYILLTALIIFNIDTGFTNFFEAAYWATTTLTTVGYGDICPHSNWGRLISMFSSLMGVAIIALPSGVITASYLRALEEVKDRKQKKR